MNNNKSVYFKKCPVCSSSRKSKVYLKKWKQSSFEKCHNCKLVFQNPQENENKTVRRYKEEYFKYELENQFNFFNLIKKTLDDFDVINKLPGNAEVLEIGSATGLFLKYMDSIGFNSTGVEICKESVMYGKNNYNVNLLNCRLEDTNFKDNTFDFIHFSHLIEHLNNPVLFLKHVKRILKKNGIVMITTPNSSGLFARYYNESWRCIVDDHLFLFNINNMKMLLSKLDLSVIKIKTWGSIPKKKNISFLKSFFDWYVKITGFGDVMCFLCKKN